MIKIKITGDDIFFEKNFTQKEVFIGRSEWNDLVLDDLSVSKKHCKISFIEGSDSFIVHDLSSRNGIQVDGKLLSEISLKSGNSFYIGDLSISVEINRNEDETREIDISMLQDNRKKKDLRSLYYSFAIYALLGIDYIFYSTEPTWKKFLIDSIEFSFGVIVFVSLVLSVGWMMKRKINPNQILILILKLLTILFALNLFEEVLQAIFYFSWVLIEIFRFIVSVHFIASIVILFSKYKVKKTYMKQFLKAFVFVFFVYGIVFFRHVIVEKEGRLFRRMNSHLNFYMSYITPTSEISSLNMLMDDLDEKVENSFESL